MPDDEVVRWVQAHPLDFALLHHRYWEEIKKYLYLRTGSLDDAEDVAQLVMIEVARKLPTFVADRPGAAFRGWLYTIARSRGIDHERSESRRRHSSITDDAVLPSSALTPEAAASFAATYEWLQHLMSRLPSGQRDVMELRCMEFSTSEIAAVLGLTEANVRTLTARARRTLQPIVFGEGGGDA